MAAAVDRRGTAGRAGADEAGARERPRRGDAASPISRRSSVARDKGFFTDENLNVTWTTVAQGAIAVEAVFGGSAEIGGGSIFEPMVARGNGLDIMFLAASTRIRSNPPDNSGIVVRTNDSIQDRQGPGRQEDLGRPDQQRRTTSTCANGCSATASIPSSVQFLEMPFPQMADALFQNRLDAVWNVEPFLTFMLRSGNARVIAYPYQENVPRMDITGYVAKESWVKANPDVARRFKRAIDRATTDLINASKEERDDWVAKYTGAQAGGRDRHEPSRVHDRVQRSEPQGQSRHRGAAEARQAVRSRDDDLETLNRRRTTPC